ncbi:uncharacterized protein LOC100869385 isoform X1 [Apis florea]|uniref:uncharacterized protein LOC100869385 isoform X1 n=1 Tax=Apis florea TaxID=7463 RepID=UPI0006299EC6|nr:uncharacterized protein LOC100869385 isoform X1 [Apis florea]
MKIIRVLPTNIESEVSTRHGHRVICTKMKKRSRRDSWQADRIIQIRASTEPREYASTRVSLYAYAREVTARPVSYRSGSRRPSVRAEKGTIRLIELKNQEIHVAVLEEGKRDAPLNPIIKTHSQRLSTFFKNDIFLSYFSILYLNEDYCINATLEKLTAYVLALWNKK